MQLAPFFMIIKIVIISTILLTSGAFLGLNLLARRHARLMLHFAPGPARERSTERSFVARLRLLVMGETIPRPESDIEPVALAPDCQSLQIGVSSDVKLAAWYCDRGPTTPLVMLFHGYSVDKTALLAEAQAFLELGASVILVDFRGSGGSSASYTTIGWLEADDVAAVFAFAKKTLIHTRHLCFGQSMGAVAIMRAIACADIEPDAVILEAIFDRLLNTVRNRFRVLHVPAFPAAELLTFWGGHQWGFNGFRHNPVEYAAHLTCPVLMMHGDQDDRARHSEARRVAAALQIPPTFVTFVGAGHESYLALDRERWLAAVKEML